MKTAPLPETLYPSRLNLSRQEIAGSVEVSSLTRFKQLLCSDDGLLNCKIKAKKDEQGRMLIIGSIEAAVKMHCQLCLKPMDIAIQQNFELMVVKDDEQAAEILENHEPIEVHHDRVVLKELIEDEALLALPLAPSHTLEEACQNHKSFSSEDDKNDKVEQTLETRQPFANLKNLMSKSSDNKD